MKATTNTNAVIYPMIPVIRGMPFERKYMNKKILIIYLIKI